MQLKEVSKAIGVSESKVRNWWQYLKKNQLISPKQGLGNRLDFDDNDINIFEQIKNNLDDGARSVPEAIRLIKRDLTPSEAIQKFEVAQQEVHNLQKKLLQIRKGFAWTLIDWFQGVLDRIKRKVRI